MTHIRVCKGQSFAARVHSAPPPAPGPPNCLAILLAHTKHPFALDSALIDKPEVLRSLSYRASFRRL
jgi:hypothetical protein